MKKVVGQIVLALVLFGVGFAAWMAGQLQRRVADAHEELALLQSFADYLVGPAQNLVCIVLHPSWPRINLPVLFLRYGHNARIFVKHHEPRASCALVNRADIVLHPTLDPMKPTNPMRFRLFLHLVIPSVSASN